MGACTKCRKPIDNQWTLCWRCKVEEENRQWYKWGYEEGQAGGKSPSSLGITKKEVTQLLQLCHPDKHNGSPLSTNLTKWLLTLRNQL